ncbi:mycofactocin biosynthesis glycosyltransferase MftF [Amycolatopsis sp. cg5]|uniref:mycofactocin biosynthesis glycosyltransferase MftF n=1 Tax=Amycolatopsis sp. cg5 TaxID=3238802 RepID=UPI0035249B26
MRTVRLDAGVRWLDDETLLGGAPPRLLRLSKTARDLLKDNELTVTNPATAKLADQLLAAGAAHPKNQATTARPVSVVIPVHNRADELRRLLDALDLPEDSEVIVVDDASDRDLAGFTPGDKAGFIPGSKARFIRHEVNRGPAAARNTGLLAARHEIVAFLDSDVVPEAGWLETLLAHFDDPRVALAAPRIVGLRKAGENALTRYEHARSSLDLGPDEALIVPRTRVAYVPSAAMLVRVSAVGDGFAEEMRVAEDVDLVCRLHADGHRLVYDPAARVAHEHRDTVGPWLDRKAFYGTGAAQLALRHPGTVPPVNLSTWAAAVCVLLISQKRWATALAAVITAVSTARLARALKMVREPVKTAARLNAMTLTGAAWQTAGALTRHWWPLALVGALFSRRIRRAVAVAAVAEGVADWWQHRGELDPVRYVAFHRVDDLAYGSGLWWGAVRHRTTAPLQPRITRGPRRRSRD